MSSAKARPEAGYRLGDEATLGDATRASDGRHELYYSSPIVANRRELSSSDSGECLDQDQSSGTTATSYYQRKKSPITAANGKLKKHQRQIQHKTSARNNDNDYDYGNYQDDNEENDEDDENHRHPSNPSAGAIVDEDDGRSGSDIDGRSTRQALILIFFLIGLIICVSSLICILLLPTFVTNQIAKKLVLKNNSLLLERWSKPNVPMYFKVWLFNVKNAQELVDKRDTKPQVEQIGPFVFNLRRQKDVVSFAGDNLYYTERRIYHFNRELSCCAINTTVTIPNIPLVAVVDRALGYNLPLLGRFIPRLINRAIQSLREQLFVRKQVSEILFDGYDVELLRMVSRIGSLVGLPQQSQRFGLLKGRNDTWRPEQDGVWAINTGQRDRKQFGRVSSWNSYKKLPFWPAPQCNVINGSDGTLFPPPIKRTEPLYIFNQELCRTVNLVYDRPSDIRSIQAYRFVLNPLNFAHTMEHASQTSRPGALLQPGTSTTGAINNQLPLPVVSATAGSGPGDLKPSASESNSVQTEVASALPPTSTSHKHHAHNHVAANLQSPADISNQNDRNKNSNTRQRQVVGPVLSQQERLIRAAQEAQLSAELRAGSQINPQTCFCDRKTTNLNGLNVCEFDGLIDLSKCSKQAQIIFGSMPHFYNSDPRLLRQVDGLEPNASKHTTYLDIEPNTGLVLGGKRRVQLNVIIKHNNEIDGFENIKDMLVPIVWFEESALIPEESAQKFRSLYIDRVRLLNWSLISLLIASIVLLLIDARLLVTTRYWRQFKLVQVAGFNSGSSGTSVSFNDVKGRQSAQRPVNNKATPAAGKCTAGKKASKFHALVKLTSSCAGGGGDSTKIGGALGACPLARASATKRQVGADLPLLNHNSSSYTSSSSSSSTGLSGTHESLSSSPPDSPEPRKWSQDWNQQRPGPDTRVYLHSLTRDGQGNLTVPSNQDQNRPRQAASMKHKSVVELSSPPETQAINLSRAAEAFDGATGGALGTTTTTTINASKSDFNR